MTISECLQMRPFCFNSFATRSSDAKENIKTTKPSTTIQNLYTPPPPWGEGGVSKMERVPEGEIFICFTSLSREKDQRWAMGIHL